MHTSDTSRPWLVHYSFLRQSRPWLVHFSLLRHFLLPFGVCSIPPTNPITPTIHFSDNHIMSTSPTKILSSLLRQNYFAHISDKNNLLTSPTKSIYPYSDKNHLLPSQTKFSDKISYFPISPTIFPSPYLLQNEKAKKAILPQK